MHFYSHMTLINNQYVPSRQQHFEIAGTFFYSIFLCSFSYCINLQKFIQILIRIIQNLKICLRHIEKMTSENS